MSAKLQLISLTSALLLAYSVSLIPGIHTFALQGFAIVVLIFFVIKRLKKRKIHHIAPEGNSHEMALLTFGFFFLIACTGNIHSPFFMLSFIHLFFLSISTTPLVSLAVVTETVILYVVMNHQMTISDLLVLLPLPLTLIIFIFAKEQYAELQKATHILERETQELVDTKKAELGLERYMQSSLLPQLATLKTIVNRGASSADELIEQITLIEDEADTMLKKINTPPEEHE